MNTTQDAERVSRVTLSYASEPGDAITAAMLTRHGAVATLDAITSSRPPDLRDIDPDVITDWQNRLAARLQTRTPGIVIESALQYGMTIVVPGDPDWPTQLDDLPNPPVALYAKGDLSPLGRDITSIVTLAGSRAATGYGEFVTRETVQGLVAEGFTVVSGVAYGIEGAAMRAALAAGDRPVAFLAGGLDRPYPAGHELLFDRIVEHGAVVSEIPPGLTPTKWRFMQRNRLLAAASSATVVVEAGTRSGALHVAANAAGLGREVAAFPGPVTSANSSGTHLLISDGVAQLVTSADDIRQLVDGATPGGPAPLGGINSLPRLDPTRSRNLSSRTEVTERTSIAL